MRDNIKRNSKKSETKRGSLISRKPKKRFSQTKNKNSPVDQVLHLQQTIGNRAVTRLFQSGAIQTKLNIGKPNDIYEKEADSVADRVMSMPEAKQSSAQRKSTCPECPEKEGIQTKPLAEQITPLIQRQAAEEEEVQTKLQRQATEEEEEPVQTKLVQRQAEEEEEVQPKLQRQANEEEEEPVQAKLLQRQEAEEEEEAVQTKLLQRQESEEEEEAQTKLQRQAEEEEEPAQTKATPGNTPEVTSNIESSINSIKGGGQPLSESTRSFFEHRFGTDFSQVRVHNDNRATQTAQAINAKAFTTGKDIVFGSGQYSPGTSSGRHLLAHELTHVVQQKGDLHISNIQRRCRYLPNYRSPDTYCETREEAASRVTTANPSECFVYHDGPPRSRYRWRPIPGLGPGGLGYGCAHYVAHQLGISIGSRYARCQEGYSVTIGQVISGIRPHSLREAQVNDIWRQQGGGHVGLVVGVDRRGGQVVRVRISECDTNGQIGSRWMRSGSFYRR